MTDLLNRFSWSFSRHRGLQECARRYYYERYASWGGWEPDAPPRTREIYRLKNVTDRHAWKGKVLHAAIAQGLRAARDGRPVDDAAGAIAAVLDVMRRDYRESREDVARRTGRFKQHVRFFEHEEDPRDGNPARRQAWKQVADDVEQGLGNFFRSRLYRRLRELPAADWIEIEDERLDPATIEIEWRGAPAGPARPVPVYVKIDCAFREGGKPVVVDWKTGRGTTEATPVQLATYALYLADRYGFDPGLVVAREVNVVTGAVIEHDVGPDALDAFRAVFGDSVGRMRDLLQDADANAARPETDFPFTDDDRACRFCHFRSVCPKITPAY